MTASDERGSKEFLGVGRMAKKVSQRNGVKLFPTREIRLVRPIENGIASPQVLGVRTLPICTVLYDSR